VLNLAGLQKIDEVMSELRTRVRKGEKIDFDISNYFDNSRLIY
jgi:hypothetical protein